MSSNGLFARHDMAEVHERILRAAEARERLPEVDLAAVSHIATQAYRAAAKDGMGMEEAERRALADLAKSYPDSATMFMRAEDELNEVDERDANQGSRHEFAYDFFFSWVMPALAAAVITWLAFQERDVWAKVALGISCVGFAIAWVVSSRRMGSVIRGAGFGGWNSMMVHSGGSIVGGLCVFLCFSYFAQQNEKQTREQELNVRLEKLNQAAAVTLAAMQAGASVKETQEAVSRSTAVDWITVEKLRGAEGAVLARAELPRTESAELRFASTSGQAPRLAAFLRTKSGNSVQYADYFAGTVVKAEIDKVTLLLSADGRERELALPAGTLPPPVHSEVVAAVTSSDNMATFLQPIDSVVLGLKR